MIKRDVDIKILQEMVHAASEAGAEIVKIQSLHSDDLTHRERFDEGITENGEITSSHSLPKSDNALRSKTAPNLCRTG